MFPLAGIIGVAVAGAVTLLVTGAILAVSLERRRRQKMARSHGFGRGLSIYYGRHLSVNDLNYRQVPPPRTALRRSVGYLENNDWHVVRSQEQVEDMTQDQPPPKRRKSLRQTLYGHSFNVPKSRKPKKLVKATALRKISRSPLSAITESSPVSAAAEMPLQVPFQQLNSHPLSTSTSEQPVIPTRMHSTGHDRQPLRPPFKPRSSSLSSTTSFAPSVAPDSPLPPIPVTFRKDNLRMSVGSVDTIETSVLINTSSPATALRQRDSQAALKDFDFGVFSRTAPVRQMSNKHHTLYGLTVGQPLSSFHGNLIEPVKPDAPPVPSPALAGSPWMYDPARRQISKTNRHSMYEHGAILGKRTLTDCFRTSTESSVPPRPASVASGNPSQWHENRPSQPRKGHKRQNCVRISNLPLRPPSRPLSRLSMPQVTEEPEHVTQIAPLSLTGRASLVDVKSTPTPSPYRKKPVRPKYVRANSSQSSGIPRPDSDVFNTTIITHSPYQPAPQRWPIPLFPTPPTSIKLNRSSPTVHPQSPYLPSPVHLHPQGPRAYPISAASRYSPSPYHPSSSTNAITTYNNNSNTTNTRFPPSPRQDLRKSIMIMRSLNSDFTHDQPQTHSQSPHFLTTLNHSRPPSTHDLRHKHSATSIWEDASCRADSPEPKTEPASALGLGIGGSGAGGGGDGGGQPRTPTAKVKWKPEEDLEAYENFVVGSGKGKYDAGDGGAVGMGTGLGFSVAGRAWGTPGSLYDQQGFLKV